MNIASIDYSPSTESLDIYVSGCNKPHCNECHNPDLWSFDYGTPYDEIVNNYIIQRCNDYTDLIKNIFIMGGEPLHQNYSELLLLLRLCRLTDKKIWLFTRYKLTQVPENFKIFLDYIKTGEYSKELIGSKIMYGVSLASTNQYIYKKEGVDIWK